MELKVKTVVPKQKAKRNCYWCRWLDRGYTEEDGWSCEKRQYETELKMGRHVEKMQDPGYLRAGKKCFEGHSL